MQHALERIQRRHGNLIRWASLWQQRLDRAFFIFAITASDDSGKHYNCFEILSRIMLQLERTSTFQNAARSSSYPKSRNVEVTARAAQDAFVLWWNNTGRNDKLRQKLESQFKLNTDKLGKGVQSRGTMFG